MKSSQEPSTKINRRTLLRVALQTGVLIAVDPHLAASESAEVTPSLLPDLADLPPLARPWVYWFWFNGNVTREGLTADLEAMHRIGIGGALILWANMGTPGPARYMSQLWYDLVRHVLVESTRLGLKIDINNDDGWSDAAGPWVTPELAMHKIVWTEVQAVGGQPAPSKLASPETNGGFFRDIAVLAYPSLTGSDIVLPRPSVRLLVEKPAVVLHDYGRAVTARSANVHLFAEVKVGVQPVTFDLEVSDDGVHFEPVHHFDNHWRWTGQEINRSLNLSVRFRPATGRYFRMRLPYTEHPSLAPAHDEEPSEAQQSSFTLLAEDRVSLWPMKAGFAYVNAALEQPDRYPGGWADQHQEFGSAVPVETSKGSFIPLQSIVDLSAHVQEGRLEWTPPAGSWTILRIGYTTVGAYVHTASKEGRGPTVNPFLKEAMDVHFAADLKKVIGRNKEFVGKALFSYHMDSSEAGPSNWSPTLAVEFEKRRGYSLLSWLPVIAGGKIVESLEQSERVLWDFRRTMSDLMAECCWGRLAELSHENGGKFSAEASGRMQYLSDPLLYLSTCDYPMAEFWRGEHEVRPDCFNCRSVANVLGKDAVLGEAYTDASWNHSPHAGEWQDHPYSLKAFGDRAFCAGVNHYIFHRSIAQPKLDELPGLAWGTPGGRHVGINMERTNTWWDAGGAWISYLSRCGYLLQQGREVVDVLVLVDEGAPNRIVKPEGLPDGFRFDGIHASVLPRVSVVNRELVVPSGAHYRVLVLPPLASMRPETAQQITRLAQAGAVLAGRKPTKSPSLQSFPSADAEVVRHAEGWGKVQSQVAQVLEALRLRPDFSCDGDVHFMHRRTAKEDIYFLSNQAGQDIQVQAEFRLAGRAPELLDPDTGQCSRAGVYTSHADATIVPLRMRKAESLFVIFRLPADDAAVPQTRIVNALGDSTDDVQVEALPGSRMLVTTASSGHLELRSNRGRRIRLALPVMPRRPLTGPWTVAFPPDRGAPSTVQLPQLISWTEHGDDGVRHFSGTATYSLSFDIASADLGHDRVALLDLGEVQVIAEATLNGMRLDTRWKPPFRWNVTEALRPGSNELRVRVTNLWPNRLIGDASQPAARQYTRTNFNPYKPTSPLLRSGILGPAVLTWCSRQTARWT